MAEKLSTTTSQLTTSILAFAQASCNVCRLHSKRTSDGRKILLDKVEHDERQPKASSINRPVKVFSDSAPQKKKLTVPIESQA